MSHQAVDVSTVYEIHKLARQNERLKESFYHSESYQLMKEIEQLEAEDKELESTVDNLHKEVDQVIRAAKRLEHVAGLEYNEVCQKISRAKLCIEAVVEDDGDFLSDPEAFAEAYCIRLDGIMDKLEEDLGAAASFMEIADRPREDASLQVDAPSPLLAFNEATRKRLLVQVEIERLNEEIRAELECSALMEPVSHPILDFEEDLDAEAEVWEDLKSHHSQPQVHDRTSFLPDVYASNKETNLCIQNAVSNLTVKAAKS